MNEGEKKASEVRGNYSSHMRSLQPGTVSIAWWIRLPMREYMSSGHPYFVMLNLRLWYSVNR